MTYPQNNASVSKSVTIISGFLGAGKTSFLNEFISYRKEIKPVIIENEFGKEGIDAGLIMASDADIFEFNSGCLCCNLNEDLYDLLGNLWQRKDEFDELIIETTGIADPAAVAQPFIVDSQVKKHYQLERVICIVDAQLIEFELAETEEARKQIVFADIIVINKCDTVSREYVKEMEILLRNINPFATIFAGDRSSGYPLADILHLTRFDFDSGIADTPAKDNLATNDAQQTLQPKSKGHQHKNISSLSFVFDEPFDVDLFAYRLCGFLNMQAKDVYRVKGFIWTKGSNKRTLVQSVSNILAITEDGRTQEAEEIRKSRIVFIGKDIKSKGIENMLRHCLVKEQNKL